MDSVTRSRTTPVWGTALLRRQNTTTTMAWLLLLFLFGLQGVSGFFSSAYTTLQEEGKCAVKSYTLRSDVRLRYATSLVQVKVANPSRRRFVNNCRLRVVIPESAFVSGLITEVGNRVFHSVVTARTQKELEAERVSLDAAAGTEQEDEESESFRIPRDSKVVIAFVSLPPRTEATFYLTYEQLLTRRLGIYELVLNLHPGQVVPELRVEAFLYEPRELAVVRVPGIRTGQDIDPLEVQSEFPLAKIRRGSLHEAHVYFAPTQEQQLQMANSKRFSWIRDSKSRSEGLAGQFVVQFEFKRPTDGEITMHEGFFVHHYAPTALTVLPKHVVFVLDLSSSMAGRKIEQLKVAMGAILDELRQGDYFSIIQFNSFKSVWSPYGKDKKRKDKRGGNRVVPVKPRFIAKAKKFIKKLEAMGGTNIQRALVKALDVAHDATTPLSLVVLLTDGETTVGDSEPARILQAVKTAIKNSNSTRHVPIYSLAFGQEADFPFLRRLSAENFGTARRLYDAEDAALQLHEVYAELSSPVMADVIFNYPETLVDPSSLTQHSFAAAYLGSELVVAGRLLQDENHPDNTLQKRDVEEGLEGESNMWGEVKGVHADGPKATLHLLIPDSEIPEQLQNLKPPLDRLWALLTIQQLLLGGAASTDARLEAMQLALENSFVTATTTLSMRSEDDRPVEESVIRLSFPAMQEIGSEVRSGRGGDDACSEGGEGEYWSPLIQAFIPCGDRKYSPYPLPTPEMEHEQRHGAGRSSDSRDEDHDTKVPAYELVSMDQLTWLQKVRYPINYIMLPNGRAKANTLFSLGLNETDLPHAPCISPLRVPSHCRHLHLCALEVFSKNYDSFLHFFCPINSFAGVCCPDALYPDT